MNINEKPEMAEKQSCYWYLAFTVSRAEQRVKRELDQREVRNYLPLWRITYQRQGHPKETLLPQITRYALIRASESDVLQLSGIQGLVIPQNIWEHRVSEWQVNSYQLLFSHIDIAVEWIPDCPELAPTVRVTEGSSNGLMGELDTPEIEMRVMIHFHAMGCFRITIPGEWIERL